MNPPRTGGEAGGPWAKRSLGQNFLRDPNIARRIVSLLDMGPGDRVLEIGPGRGALTGHVLETGRAVGAAACAAVEKDAALAAALKAEHPELALCVGDAMQMAWERLGREGRPWKVVGNLPYNVASPLMWELFSRAGGLERAVFMVQKEVGRRLAAQPGTKAYGALTVWVQSFVRPRVEFIVGPGAFSPRPKVDSAVLRFLPRDDVEPFDREALSGLLKTCFQKRRKQMGNILKSWWNDDLDTWFAAPGRSPSMRPEDLSPGWFRSLTMVMPNGFTS